MDARQEFLMQFYGMDAECAAEILSELPSTQSLESLACYRVGTGGAKSENTAP